MRGSFVIISAVGEGQYASRVGRRLECHLCKLSHLFDIEIGLVSDGGAVYCCIILGSSVRRREERALHLGIHCLHSGAVTSYTICRKAAPQGKLHVPQKS